MPDNLPTLPPAFAALPDHAVVSLSGADATAFAHAQFANDVARLAAGQWQWNAWLTPKGRVIATFALIKRSETELLLIVPDYRDDSLALSLQRFVFRRKVRIETRADLYPSGTFAAPLRAHFAQVEDRGDEIELDYGGSAEKRTLRIAGAAAPQTDGFAGRWRASDLRHGLVRLDESQREQWTPQQLALERLHAFSVKKGCYPGQEIVARTHFLGKAKRSLALLESDAPLAAGAEVCADDRGIGTVVSVANDGHLAAAVLPLEREAVALTTGAASLREIPLLDGLERPGSA
ncbi:MAG TPA: folate-binding protein [Pseudoxanthomonas sp.]|nr:folate-binding protein [Pseudoxanthomonas sp.]